MACKGYQTCNNKYVKVAFIDIESKFIKNVVKVLFNLIDIKNCWTMDAERAGQE